MGLLNLSTLPCLAFVLPQVLGNPAPQGISSHSVGCSDACYSAIATYDMGDNPYSGNGICYSWLSHYPPAQTTQTFTGTEYLATVSPTTFVTRIETVWTMGGGATPTPAAVSSAAPTTATALSTQAKRGLERRQTTSAVAASSSVAGLPLPNSNIASSCNNDPAAFASACSCIGDSGQTHPAYTTTTISSTSTHDTIIRECTSTVTAPACAATASYGLQANTLRFGDSYQPSSANTTLYSNNTTAEECCNACYTSDQNCRFFTYTPPADASSSNQLADGGSCSLNLEGTTCPWNVLPPNTFPYDYNYINEGMYNSDGGQGSYWSFGPCAVEVPYFYGYQNGRAGVGTCTASTAVATVTGA